MSISSTKNQTPTPRKFRLGVAYYPDYLTEKIPHYSQDPDNRYFKGDKVDRGTKIRTDLQRMQRSGIAEVRVGEFAWSLVQPSEEQWDFGLFDQFLAICSEESMQVIFCTPSACPPIWLLKKFPDLLPVDKADKKMHFGSRRHYDPCHDGYQKSVEVLVRKLAERYANHPTILGWQIDNEFGHHGSHYLGTHAATLAFQIYLEERYGTIKELNENWFTCFWSQVYSDFREISPPKVTFADVNPHLELDFKRFCSKVYESFCEAQASILRDFLPKGCFITTNYISDFYEIDPFALGRSLDVVGFDHYQHGSVPNPTRSASNFTLMRSIKDGKPFKILEQQPVQVNWQDINTRFDHDCFFLWALQAMAFGADSFHCFSWQRFYGGAEQYHDGIVGHDTRVDESWQEKVLSEIEKLFQKQGACFGEVECEVAIIHNCQSMWTHDICSQSTLYDAREVVDRFTSGFLSFGKSFLFFSDIEKAVAVNPKVLILASYAFELSPQEDAAISAYVHAGGQLVTLPRSLMKNKGNQMLPRPMSILESDLVLEEFGALAAGEVELCRLHGAGEMVASFKGELWSEKWVSVNHRYEALGCFESGIYEGSPSVLRRKYGEDGSHIHFAAVFDLEEHFMSWFLNEVGLSQQLHVSTTEQVQIIPIQTTKNFMLINFSKNQAQIHGVDAHHLKGVFYSLNRNNELDSFDWQTAETTGLPGYSVAFVEVVA